MYDLLIIGGGTAGLTAALYAARAGKSALILEKETFGGQITSSPRIENYPALPAVSGVQFADQLLTQAMDAGAEIELEEIDRIEKKEDFFVVHAGKRTFEGRKVILATGVRHRTLELPNEDLLTGHGISYCAVCDGAFFKGQHVAVAGGGSSAVQAAAFLAEICESVTLIHRREGFRCEETALQALKQKKNVRFMLNKRITALSGDDHLTGVQLNDTQTHEQTMLSVDGLFVMIGQMANNERFKDMVVLDEQGSIVADVCCRTSCAGVFAAGDCRVKTVRQLTTAAADGAIAALTACNEMD